MLLCPLDVVSAQAALDLAVDAARIHHGFVPDEVREERTTPLDAKVRAELRKRGHVMARTKANIGDANSVLLRGGEAWAVADRREGGLALAATRSGPGTQAKP